LQLQLLEEKHTLSRRHPSTPVTKDVKPEEVDGKNLSNALEQVYLKGTMMDRLEKLEMRVLQVNCSSNKLMKCNFIFSDLNLAIMALKSELLITFILGVSSSSYILLQFIFSCSWAWTWMKGTLQGQVLPLFHYLKSLATAQAHYLLQSQMKIR